MRWNIDTFTCTSLAETAGPPYAFLEPASRERGEMTIQPTGGGVIDGQVAVNHGTCRFPEWVVAVFLGLANQHFLR
jgi:hypothetical protein